MSDLYPYDFVHPPFLESMGEQATESLILSLQKYPGVSDKELIEKSGLSRGTLYGYKKSLQRKAQI